MNTKINIRILHIITYYIDNEPVIPTKLIILRIQPYRNHQTKIEECNNLQ
jgi:hypothetical protein